MNAKQTGDHFERQACQFLTEQGLAIIATNFTLPKVGEIDIIATHTQTDRRGNDRTTLIFIEVKARTSSRFAHAKDAITPTKQRRIITTAEHFLQQNEQFVTADCRFDVVTFEGDERGVWVAEWLQGAFLVA